MPVLLRGRTFGSSPNTSLACGESSSRGILPARSLRAQEAKWHILVCRTCASPVPTPPSHSFLPHAGAAPQGASASFINLVVRGWFEVLCGRLSSALDSMPQTRKTLSDFWTALRLNPSAGSLGWLGPEAQTGSCPRSSNSLRAQGLVCKCRNGGPWLSPQHVSVRHPRRSSVALRVARSAR